MLEVSISLIVLSTQPAYVDFQFSYSILSKFRRLYQQLKKGFNSLTFHVIFLHRSILGVMICVFSMSATRR